MNAVQNGVSQGSALASFSFIFGIGNFPSQFHSRYLVDTKYNSATGGQIIGARGTGYQFFDGSNYVYLDGRFNILNSQLGALGNGYKGETTTKIFDTTKTFKNGKKHIPGWINGAFDTTADSDTIFNYKDNLDTYEFTETTNEMVASAVELLAYLDGRMNNKARYAKITFGNIPLPPQNTTTPPPPPPPTNTSNGCYARLQDIPAICSGTLTKDTFDGCRNIICTGSSGSVTVLACDKPDSSSPQNFEMYKQLQSGNGAKVCLAGVCIEDNGYAKSSNYPVCPSTAPPPPSCTPSTEVCDSLDNDCDAQIDEGNVCSTPPPNGCYNNVQSIPATCSGGTITQDTFDGCRAITCSNGASNLKILACDKPSVMNPTSFEMYKQSAAGSLVKNICLGSVCAGDAGFAKATYPFCPGSSNNPPPPPPEPSQPSGIPNPTCTDKSAAKNCIKLSDVDDGSCRTVSYSEPDQTQEGIRAQACKKGSMIEVSRQNYNSAHDLEICFGTVCVDKWWGYRATG